MNFELEYTAEHEEFRQHVREWIKANVPNIECPAEMEELDNRMHSLAWDLRRRLAAKGWLHPSLPKEYGGAGLSLQEQEILQEELSLCPMPAVYDRSNILNAALLRVGTEEQKKKFLTLSARGQIVVWQCFTEPDAGTDLASLCCQAVPTGNGFVLNGCKTYTGDCRQVDYLYTLAVTDAKAPRHANISAFLVKADSRGISRTPLRPIAGAQKNTIYFENVIVPKENLIGEINKGWAVANISLAAERAAWGNVLRLNSLFDEFLEYCKHTKRNGRPLASNPRVADLLVNLFLEIRTRDLLSARNAWRRRTGIPNTYEAAQAALHTKRLLPLFASTLLEIAGPYALVRDKWAILRGRVEHFQRRSLMTHGGGTPEAQRMVIAKALNLGRG
ncbi:acyl-CoA dehydrogenase family protein [Chloroflexota bacterium]